MNLRSPPRVARWLLAHLLLGPQSDSIAGDILERFHDGESRWWLWRQTLGAVGAGLVRTARRHGPSFLGAFTAAFAIEYAYVSIDPAIRNAIIHWQSSTLLQIDPHWRHSLFWTIAITVVAWAHVLIWFAAAGWIAARIHRAHPRLAVSCIAAAQFAMSLPWTIRLAQDFMTHPRYGEYLRWQIISSLITTATLLVSGLLAARSARRQAA